MSSFADFFAVYRNAESVGDRADSNPDTSSAEGIRTN